jgi:hypothetical protein
LKRLLLVVVMAACSSDTDLGGVYMVTADVSSSPCGADAPMTPSPAYLSFTQTTFFGAKIWTFEICSDAAGSNCDSNSSGGVFGGFSEPIDNGWKGAESAASFSDPTCYLNYYLRTAILTGKTMVIESTNYNDSPALDQAHCTADEAEQRGATMPCMMHERIEATKL